MNQSKQRRMPRTWFDARSVMLFAAFTVGGAAVQAQTAPARDTRTAQTSQAKQSGTTIGPSAAPATREQKPAPAQPATTPAPVKDSSQR
ncbi:hypothetical protein [Diaphorobacter aerolatus]|uniref:Uncharacterized protein n=1 Tax=Diaphorobacter aerolatus TaxID=1288495 RepID=A0A7H0GQV9_9BURK|nr:hypothetical protein [Diaphorobacter aerolatus]QNP50675.1 hypothetical protein H9K75_13090 [Diaphorobacter aerolatus]